MNVGDRIEAMRRLGRRMVVCAQCAGTMREPPDPFEGPNVLWFGEGVSETVFHVCSSGCHDKLRARLKSGERVE